MTAGFRIRLLGPTRVELAGKLVRGFESRKALALLCYLAVQRQPVTRRKLTGYFWNDKPEARGRANLSRVLHNLSSLLPGHVRADRNSVEIVGDPTATPAGHWLDVVGFEQLLESDQPEAWCSAADLYRGEFMEDVHLDGCPEFESWLNIQRNLWRRRAAQAMHKLMVHHGLRGDVGTALNYGTRLLQIEPTREDAHRHMMRLLMESGQRSAALRQYETCRRILDEQLGIAPTAATTALYDQIRSGAGVRDHAMGQVLAAAPASASPAERPQRQRAAARAWLAGAALAVLAFVAGIGLGNAVPRLSPPPMSQSATADGPPVIALATVEAPRIVMTSPAGDLVALSAGDEPLLVEGAVLAANGRARLTLSVDDRVVADYEVNEGGLNSFRLEWLPPGAGTYRAVVQAVTADGLSSDAVTFRVAVSPPPTVTPPPPSAAPEDSVMIPVTGAELTPTPGVTTPAATALVTAGTNVNVRALPHVDAQVLGVLTAGDIVPALGRLSDLSWIQIGFEGRTSDKAWVFSTLVELNVPPETLPVVEP